jgi:hypothetical protein
MINYPITIEVDEDYWECSHDVEYVIVESK